MTDEKPKETPKEKPNREKFPTQEEEIVIENPDKLPRTKR
jgi:hypothetical protein